LNQPLSLALFKELMLMHAIQYESFGPAGVLASVELPRPEPQRDEVLIRVSAAGVSYVDIRQRQGMYNRSETRVGGVTLPNVPGMQAVGRVVSVGPQADPKLMGRKVVTFVGAGAYAEFLIAPASLCALAPDSADDATLAVMPMQGLTAYFTLTAATVLRPGESILIHAAGSGVGSLAVQMAKIMGAGKIIATAASPEKRQYATSIGADIAVDYTAADWTQKVLEATAGVGVDVLLESIGGEVFEQNFDCLATFGRYVVYGSTRGLGKPLEARRLMTRCQSLTGLYVPVFMARPDLVRAGLEFMVEHVSKGDLRAQVAAELPLREAARAQQLLEDRQVVGAVVLKP
jgi:NADPH:quinone reductase